MIPDPNKSGLERYSDYSNHFGVFEEDITGNSECFLGSRIYGARQTRLIEHLAEKALCIGAGYCSHKLNIVRLRNCAS